MIVVCAFLWLMRRWNRPLLKMMVKGSADCLNSAFHLSYNMRLNQLRSEDGDPENLLCNSLYQFQADRAIPDLEKQMKVLREEKDSIHIKEEKSLENYYFLLRQYRSFKKDIRDIIFSPKYCLPFLQPGRLVCVCCVSNDENTQAFSIEDHVTWSVIVNFQMVKGLSEDDTNKSPEDANYTVDILTRCAVSRDGTFKENNQDCSAEGARGTCCCFCSCFPDTELEVSVS